MKITKDQVRPAVIDWVADRKHIATAEVTDAMVVGDPENGNGRVSMVILGIGTTFPNDDKTTVAHVISTFEELCDLAALAKSGRF